MAEFNILDHWDQLAPDGGANDPEGDHSFKCPSCGAKNFKVHIRTGMWHGWSCECCRTEEGKRRIRDALSPACNPSEKPKRSKQTRCWDYYTPRTLEAGRPALTVHRADSGDGQRRIWQESRVGPDVKPAAIAPKVLPYGYAEAKKALEESQDVLVYWVEGEPCVDALRELGLVAVTSLGGCGQFKPERDGNHFPPDRLVVVPDRDRPGLEYAEKVAAAYPGCRWLYPFPGTPQWNGQCPANGGLDIADWLSEGATLADIAAGVGARSHSANSAENAAEAGESLQAADFDDDLALRSEALQHFRQAQQASIDLPAVLGPIWGQLLIDRAAAFPCDPVILLLPLLGYVASLVGTHARVRVKDGWLEPLLIWGLVAQPASSLKSPAGNVFLVPLNELQRREKERYDHAFSLYKSEEKTWKAECERLKKNKSPIDHPDAPEPPTPFRHYYVENVTIERLGSIHAQPNVRGLIAFHDELADWFSSLERNQKASDRARWLRLWGGSSIKHDTLTSANVYCSETAISLVGFIQPDKLAALHSLETKTDFDSSGDGLWARFLPVIPRTVPYRFNTLEVVITQNLLCLAQQLDQIPQGSLLDFHPDALAVLEPALNAWGEQETNCSASRAAFLGKLRGYSVRLAGLLHLLNDQSSLLIQPETVQRAITLSNYFLNQFDLLAPQVASGASDISETTARFLSKVRDRDLSHVSVRDLQRWKILGRNTPAKDARTFLENLAQQGVGSIQQASAKGSKKGSWVWVRGDW